MARDLTARATAALAAGALMAATPTQAVEIHEIDVGHRSGTYSVRFDVLLASPLATTSLILRDYRQWQRLTTTLKQSELKKILPDGRQRVALTFQGCVLFICRTIRQVKDVEIRTGGDVATEIVPGEGDFEGGHELWRIVPENGHTRIRYDAELTPSFLVPPLIGPWLLTRQLRNRLIALATRLEVIADALSRHPGVAGEQRVTDF